MTEKTPALPFYGKDAYDDETFERLTFAEQGMYLRLAWWQWQEGSIPADIELILDKLSRRKVAEARRCWRNVESLFPPIPENPTRRLNPTIEKHRAHVIEQREKHRRGAERTNAKRALSVTLCEPPSEPLSDSNSVSLRAAPALALDSDSVLVLEKDRELVSLNAAEAISQKLASSALSLPPTDQVTFAWVQEFGAELIIETLADCEDQYRGKHWKYLEKILANRLANPELRPSQRRKGARLPIRKAADLNPDLTIGRSPDPPAEMTETERKFERWRRGGIWVAEHGRDEAQFNAAFAKRRDFAVPMTFDEWCLLDGERPWEQREAAN